MLAAYRRWVEDGKTAPMEDVIAAASLLVNEVNEQTLSWYGRQDENLNDSALGAYGENSCPEVSFDRCPRSLRMRCFSG